MDWQCTTLILMKWKERVRFNDKVRGNVFIGSIDFTYKKYNWIVRGQADYGTLSGASVISNIKS